MVVLLNVMCMLHSAGSKPIDMTAATTLDKCHGNTLSTLMLGNNVLLWDIKFFCNLETQACNACHSRQCTYTCTTLTLVMMHVYLQFMMMYESSTCGASQT